MELRQLAYLVAVVDEGSFTAAARREHVAQPGVSAQILRLEAELGLQLLDRGGGRVTPTAAGAAVLPHARAALAAVAGVRHAVDAVAGLERGRVAIGAAPACASALAPAMAAFHDAHPGIELVLTEDASEPLLEAVRDGGLDLALAGVHGPLPPGLESQSVLDAPVLAAVPPGHPLARRRSVTARALAEHPLVTLPRGTGLRAALDAGFRARGLTPRIAIEAGDPRVLADLARRGLGVAVLPGAHPEGLLSVEVTAPRMRSSLVLVWRADGAPAPAAAAFLALARDAGLALG
jgi:DNA-binding transcriptional LysR family regulator